MMLYYTECKTKTMNLGSGWLRLMCGYGFCSVGRVENIKSIKCNFHKYANELVLPKLHKKFKSFPVSVIKT